MKAWSSPHFMLSRELLAVRGVPECEANYSQAIFVTPITNHDADTLIGLWQSAGRIHAAVNRHVEGVFCGWLRLAVNDAVHTFETRMDATSGLSTSIAPVRRHPFTPSCRSHSDNCCYHESGPMHQRSWSNVDHA
jgi:hypothetical protein